MTGIHAYRAEILGKTIVLEEKFRRIGEEIAYSGTFYPCRTECLKSYFYIVLFSPRNESIEHL
jgi:hypothetical protein